MITNKLHNINNNILLDKILKDINILYIEDELNIRMNISKTLKLIVNNVFDLPDTVHALDILNNNKIDLIICDINLPKQNGIDFVKIVREKFPKLPTILLSASTDKKYLLEATRLKLIDYLVKPIDFVVLQNALHKVALEILEEGKYVLKFKDDIFYNYMEKKLYKHNIENAIPLTSNEILLLDFLIIHDQRLISQEEIKATIWEDEEYATDSALKNLISKLRKKIGKNSIVNTSGFGYKIDYNN
ncbi:response regulator transcription factor [Arcobacter sp.]|uniref:response regulator transcription factor n=1 Tax=unclassified Arcobacter TaxID=2593671 RepID=UPI003B0045CD|eukprot:TRINITY_DN1444_c0_g3_i2.p2 TRINITY_DN1444_c0_g3~~TRINITY_DN1444_c0_g3_i2.p2  ORF type:complete len:245 (+),score=-46.36 TRINITY_DN1444_c0_g3_i2:13-747(+)